MKYTLGIYGFGFVGKAVAFAFGNDNEILYYDLNERNTEIEGLCKSDIIFIGLPTPMDVNTGVIDLSIIESAIDNLNNYNYKGIIVIKSTVIPGTTNRLSKLYPNLRITFSPEFLTERSANLDFINATRIVIGGKKEDCDYLETFFRTRFVHTPIFKTDSDTAEFIKYMCNVFFSTKVIYFNIMYKAAEKFGMDWDMALKGCMSEQRIGNSHYNVPGPDGDFGFGGKCFPKDLNAFINWLRQMDMKDEAELFELVWKLNLKYRSNLNWLTIKGATSGKKS